MLILSAIINLLQSIIQRFLLRFAAPLHLHRNNKLIQRAKNSHRHTPQKPEWLKREIIRLKAIMPQAGCRCIADICNRRYAASHRITIGKTCVHLILQRNQYEIQILRRNLKHAKPKAVPRNLIWGLDLTGKTDTNGKLHALIGILDHGSRALLHLQALHDKTTPTIIHCLNQIIRTYGKPKPYAPTTRECSDPLPSARHSNNLAFATNSQTPAVLGKTDGSNACSVH